MQPAHPRQAERTGDLGANLGAPALSEAHLSVWRRFLRSHAMIIRRLEADLLAEQGLPLASYDVLLQLVEAPGHRLRMTELAERVLLSRSGLTRLVDRLEREELVSREACSSDARGLFAVLTEAGYARLRRASPTHLRGVQDYALGLLDEQQLAAFADVLDRLIAGNTAPAVPAQPAAVEVAARVLRGPAE